ncbi:MAG: preprotein translocase subunit SecA [Patescibacteria group bacterium]
MFNTLKKIFKGNATSSFQSVVNEINNLESDIRNLSDEDLKRESAALKNSLGEQVSLDNILPRAFALVREASRRTLGQRHFDSQIIGGIVLHKGRIAEMMTGEGKTLSATTAAYLNALSGKGVHVVTVNDYLARRDASWMGQIYNALGLTVSCIVHNTAYRYDSSFESGGLDKERDELGNFKVVENFLRPISRKDAYLADITYGTNHEFGFDFLRDNLALRLNDKVQREHNYVIIDEVDSILIDEARTPLIIASPDQESSSFYKVFATVSKNLQPEEDYLVDEKLKSVSITDSGIEKVEKMLKITNIYSPESARLVHFLQESLKAKALFNRDKEYIVKNGEIIIVDEFTGRLLQGRRYSGGLHQAIEAKEGVQVKDENRTYAQITIQNYFRLYKKISGMTGTAQTSAEEFHKVYNLEVVVVPTNRPMVRHDAPDVVYKNKKAKYQAIVEEVKKRHEKGQPILLGTSSISNNEIISDYLKHAGIVHEVLNAKNNEKEGAIIAQAGRSGAITVATNVAGRGVDIVLGGNPATTEEARRVVESGGLHVIGTERHEARRIDNQLRGRSGRQGDAGGTQFFLSLEDDLLRIFGGDKIGRLMDSFNLPEDLPIESRMVSSAVNQAQARVEGANLDLRKHLLEFDDVLNKQRTAVYKRRLNYLELGEKNEIRSILEEALKHFVDENIKNIGLNPEVDLTDRDKKVSELNDKLQGIPKEFERERSVAVAEHMVRILDMLWIGNLENLEALRESVNIRAYGQHEPLVEYRKEAFKLFQELSFNFESMLFNTVFEVLGADIEKLKNPVVVVQKPRDVKEPGRNDPCWCGSGKKHKKCHGK